MKSSSLSVAQADSKDLAETSIEGRAILSSGKEFEFTASNVTPLSADLCADIIVRPGETLVCHLEDIALLPGRVVSVNRVSFQVAFDLTEERFAKVAAQLEWHAGRAARNADLRRCPRIVPRHTAVDVWLGQRISCAGTILNISMSGAAIKLEAATIPFIGSRVRIGSRFATVVRLMESGIGVEFVEPFTPENFDDRVRP